MNKRYPTAIFLIALAIYSVFFAPYWVFLILSAGVFLQIIYEFAQMTKLHGWSLVFAHGLLGYFLTSLISWNIFKWMIVCAILIWIVIGLMLAIYPKLSKFYAQSPMMRLITFSILIQSAWLSHLNVYNYSSTLLFITLLSVWIFDSGCYWVGKNFGKNFLQPNLSPKKTWEGLFGGVGFLIAFYIILLLIGVSVSFYFLALVWFFSLIGDLYESSLKRTCHIKDSGSFLPGHGGAFDRLDSYLAAIVLHGGVVFWL